MDIAYDHIQEEALLPDDVTNKEEKAPEPPTLNDEFAQAYKAISSSSWGTRLGALVGTVKKQGESVYEGARQEYTAASSQASKGLNDIINRTRSLSLTKSSSAQPTSKEKEGASKEDDAGDAELVAPIAEEKTKSNAAVEEEASTATERAASRASEGGGGGVLSRFRSEAFKRLKDLEKAEDAADEALLNFGTNVRNFLRDAVSIAPPLLEEGDDGHESRTEKPSTLLYESKDPEGKRVFHTTRFEAQLHAIHSNVDHFTHDPIDSPEYATWSEGFRVDQKTADISADLERYKELRTAMERLVPDLVKYEDFWRRYYFLRHIVEAEERRRKELLKDASTAADEEVAWDEESDAEADADARGQDNDEAGGRDASDKAKAHHDGLTISAADTPRSTDSSSPLQNPTLSAPLYHTTTAPPAPPATASPSAPAAPHDQPDTDNNPLTNHSDTSHPPPPPSAPSAPPPSSTPLQAQRPPQPQPRPQQQHASNDQLSLPDSEASYDVVSSNSGAASGTPGSPPPPSSTTTTTHGFPLKKGTAAATTGEESDEDWE
ncbi:MAG: hypothetical protein M1826_003151 [Phylliscum demangeonii]|nr:MAG: hypothetical protein M1826_003151 [Phylliscum demangeonii]